MRLSIPILGFLFLATQSFALEPPGDLDVGIYFAHGAEWKELPVEIVNWKTGGVLKYIFTDGIVREDLNGRIRGGESRIALSATSGVAIFVRTIEGVSVEEYQLLRLRQHTDAREFRSVTGGIFHVSGGAARDNVPFAVRREGPRLWRIVLADLPNGEYGFLPPVNSSSLAASGKIYSFQVSTERMPGAPSAVTAPARAIPAHSILKSLMWPRSEGF